MNIKIDLGYSEDEVDTIVDAFNSYVENSSEDDYVYLDAPDYCGLPSHIHDKFNGDLVDAFQDLLFRCSHDRLATEKITRYDVINSILIYYQYGGK